MGSTANEIVAFNKAQIFDALERAGVSMSVTYSGEGDSGNGFEISFFKPEGGVSASEVETPAVRSRQERNEWDRETGQWRKASVEEREIKFDDAVESLCSDLISEAGHDGYENNEGGGGEFTFNVGSREIELQHYDNIVHQEYSSCTF